MDGAGNSVERGDLRRFSRVERLFRQAKSFFCNGFRRQASVSDDRAMEIVGRLDGFRVRHEIEIVVRDENEVAEHLGADVEEVSHLSLPIRDSLQSAFPDEHLRKERLNDEGKARRVRVFDENRSAEKRAHRFNVVFSGDSDNGECAWDLSEETRGVSLIADEQNLSIGQVSGGVDLIVSGTEVPEPTKRAPCLTGLRDRFDSRC